MADLPSGTVTFLFTDIEGSTALWERDRAAMQTAVDRHLALLDAAIASHHGVHFKTVGDAVQAAFNTAPDAVAAALDAQQALQLEQWPAGIASVRVRMALHTAAATPQDGDYLAPGLNRLARLLAAGHGGQVLLSLATQDLARDALPVGVDLRDLGEHPLRDLYRPERVCQLLHPNLPQDFPLLRTLATRPNNLPLQPTPFLGREDQIAQTADLLSRDDVRLLTITGPGGVGKTRLALQAAADLLDTFPDGVWFVDLSALIDPTRLPAAIAAVLGVRGEGNDLMDRLLNIVSGQHLLVVLDNFEQVIDAAQTVFDLLAGAPGLKVLTTSRTPLHAYGEREFPLSPLPLPDPAHLPSVERMSQYEAVRLFIQRAQAVKPDFAVTTENAPAVAEICFRLDGLPLAIELAAAIVKVLPPQALLKRLQKRLPLLTGGAQTLPARQQTMHNTIAWSHDLLSSEEQLVFRRLAVFPGGCTLEAAESIVNLEGSVDVFSGMASLVDKSLLRQEEGLEGDPRFRMLETVREYALERFASSPDEERVWRSHLAYLLHLAAENDLAEAGATFEERLARLGAEEPNLRAALEWGLLHDPETALALNARLGQIWWELGRLTARLDLDLHERILATGVGAESPERARALASAAWLAGNLGDFAKGNQMAEASFSLAERLGEARIAAFARYCQGALALGRASGTETSALLQDALTRFEALGDQAGAADCLNILGLNANQGGDAAAAVSFFARSLALAEAHQGPRYRARALGNLALAHHYLGHHKEAEDFSTQALALAEQVGSMHYTAYAHTVSSLAALNRGEIALAAQRAQASITKWGEFGDKWGVTLALEFAAAILVASERHEAAARLYGAVDAQREAIAMPVNVLDQPAHDRHLAAVRAALDEAAFTRAWQDGRQLAQPAAVAETAEILEAIGGGQGVEQRGLVRQ